MLLVAFLIRLVFLNADGFKNDVVTFEAWSLTLAEHPLREFFAKAGFADYPPGYFFILWLVGHAYKLLIHGDPSWTLLKFAVKLPAVVMDIVDAWLLFAIVRRFAALPWAFAAAAFFAFNPATIFISAYWGQVDSVAAGFTLLSVLLVPFADGYSDRRAFYALTGAWLAIAYSILIKPPALVVVPLLLAFAFVAPDAKRRNLRLLATGAGLLGAFGLAYVAALAFHPGLNPVDQFTWLYGRYQYASSVYPDNSVNAFNLYALRQPFWQPDTQLVPNLHWGSWTIGLPQYVWGIGLFAVAALLVILRYLQRRDGLAFVEGAMLLSLAFFILSTRMHERYVFSAFALMPALMFAGRRYVVAAVALSLTLFANLAYSLDYLTVMDHHVAGLDATNLMPFLSRPAALVNVVLFFYLGYAFLGARTEAIRVPASFGDLAAGVALRARRWFAPLEGLAPMHALDYAIAAGLSVLSFVMMYVNFWIPGEKIFDEIYYARAAEEYLAHKEIFEFTHPPLTKLVITLSTRIFGDNAYGWRFDNVVIGALMVFVMYVFAKRLLRSTVWATVCAGLLAFDGFHFVQSRIATPEITVAFFSLTTLYALYRFWIARQIRVAPLVTRTLATAQSVTFALGTLAAALLTATVVRGQTRAAHVVAFLYLELAVYLIARVVVPRFVRGPRQISYADGSATVGGTLTTFDGGRISAKGNAVAGERTRPERGGAALAYADEDLTISYQRDGTEVYRTPEGSARFCADGELSVEGARVDARAGTLWMWLLALSGGCLAASKWNGLFDFFVIFGIVIAVAAQGAWTPVLRAVGLATRFAPAQWGNPRGFSVDIAIATFAFVAATIYALTYIPYFGLGHNLGDLVSLQQQMFGYHYDLHATHPYSSKWWQWPLLEIPISYYYKDFRPVAQSGNGAACCVSEIMALPNPLIWWLGLISVPFMAYLGWRERNKGYALLTAAYLLQWLPWIASPRIAFEYHFFPNLAIIVLADGVLLHRVWQAARTVTEGPAWPRIAVGVYLAAVFVAFIFWYPVVAGTHLSYDAWNARMLTGLMHNLWINPHPGQ
ncbi:MAG: glycosyltransferase family 39 protein [Candidatus Baltobacteraceae bacterium]